MKIKVQKARINAVPSVIIYTEDWSKQELDNILRFGEPLVDIGGEFSKHPSGSPTPDDPGIHDGRLSNQVKKFFKKLLEVTPETSDTSYELQKWLLDLKQSIMDDTPSGGGEGGGEGGGSSGAGEDENKFWLPTEYKEIKRGFPILKAFSSETFEDPEKIGKLWADEIARRIAIEVKGLRYLGTMFTKEEVYEI